MTEQDLIKQLSDTSYMQDKAATLAQAKEDKLSNLTDKAPLLGTVQGSDFYDADSPFTPTTIDNTKPTMRLGDIDSSSKYFFDAPEAPQTIQKRYKREATPEELSAYQASIMAKDAYALKDIPMPADYYTNPEKYGQPTTPATPQEWAEYQGEKEKDYDVLGGHLDLRGQEGRVGKYGRQIAQAYAQDSHDPSESLQDRLLTTGTGKMVGTAPVDKTVTEKDPYKYERGDDSRAWTAVKAGLADIGSKSWQLLDAVNDASKHFVYEMMTKHIEDGVHPTDNWVDRQAEIYNAKNTKEIWEVNSKYIDKANADIDKALENENLVEGVLDAVGIAAMNADVYLTDNLGETAMLLFKTPGLLAAVGTRLNEDIETYKKNHNGQDPSGQRILEMLAGSTTALTMEQLIMIKPLAKIIKRLKGKGTEVGKKAVGAIMGTTGSGLGEMGQEMFDTTQQTYTTTDKLPGGKELLKAATTGLGTGGAIRGVGEAAVGVKEVGTAGATILGEKYADLVDDYADPAKDAPAKTREGRRTTWTSLDDPDFTFEGEARKNAAKDVAGFVADVTLDSDWYADSGYGVKGEKEIGVLQEAVDKLAGMYDVTDPIGKQLLQAQIIRDAGIYARSLDKIGKELTTKEEQDVMLKVLLEQAENNDFALEEVEKFYADRLRETAYELQEELEKELGQQVDLSTMQLDEDAISRIKSVIADIRTLGSEPMDSYADKVEQGLKLQQDTVRKKGDSKRKTKEEVANEAMFTGFLLGNKYMKPLAEHNRAVDNIKDLEYDETSGEKIDETVNDLVTFGLSRQEKVHVGNPYDKKKGYWKVGQIGSFITTQLEENKQILAALDKLRKNKNLPEEKMAEVENAYKILSNVQEELHDLDNLRSTYQDRTLYERLLDMPQNANMRNKPMVAEYLSTLTDAVDGKPEAAPVEVTPEEVTPVEEVKEVKEEDTTPEVVEEVTPRKLKKFDEKLHKKLETLLKKLYPEIKLEYTEQEILYGEGLMNQEVQNNTIKYSLKVVDALVNIAKDRKTIRLNSKDKPNIEKNLEKLLLGKGVSKDQVGFIFEYMRQNNIQEIETEYLAMRLLEALASHAQITTATKSVDKRIEHELEYLREADPLIPEEWFEEERKKQQDKASEPTDYYYDLTVPGGINYKEVEIKTPKVKAQLKGHARFATDEGIGWYRVDDDTEQAGTLRVLEMQSDMFQKMRDENLSVKRKREHRSKEALVEALELASNKQLQKEKPLVKAIPVQLALKRGILEEAAIGNEEDYLVFTPDSLDYSPMTVVKSKVEATAKAEEMSSEAYDKKIKYLKKAISEYDKDNIDLDKSFHQILNTDNKWVKFFIQSMIQNAQRNGYTKIKFPSGETAAEIEGHETIAEQIQEIDNEINSETKILQTVTYLTDTEIESVKTRIKQLEKQKQELKTEGIEKLVPIEGFYQVRVRNTLVKEYGRQNVKTVTDEHGNKWFELELDAKRDSNVIMLQKEGTTGQIKGQADIEAGTVLINSLLQSQDTLPHEYAHHYIAWFRDAPIVQEAIKKWGSEEALVQAIGEQVVEQKGEVYNWWKKFTDWLQKKFDGLDKATKEELRNLLTDAFLTRKDLSKAKPKPIEEGVSEYKRAKEGELEPEAKTPEEAIEQVEKNNTVENIPENKDILANTINDLETTLDKHEKDLEALKSKKRELLIEKKKQKEKIKNHREKIKEAKKHIRTVEKAIEGDTRSVGILTALGKIAKNLKRVAGGIKAAITRWTNELKKYQEIKEEITKVEKEIKTKKAATEFVKEALVETKAANIEELLRVGEGLVKTNKGKLANSVAVQYANARSAADLVKALTKMMPAIIKNMPEEARDERLKAVMTAIRDFREDRRSGPKGNKGPEIPIVKQTKDKNNILTRKFNGVAMTDIINSTDPAISKHVKTAMAISSVVMYTKMQDFRNRPSQQVEESIEGAFNSLFNYGGVPADQIKALKADIIGGKITPVATFSREAGRLFMEELGISFEGLTMQERMDMEQSLGELVTSRLMRANTHTNTGIDRKVAIIGDGFSRMPDGTIEEEGQLYYVGGDYVARKATQYAKDGRKENIQTVKVYDMTNLDPEVSKGWDLAGRTLQYAQDKEGRSINLVPAKYKEGKKVKNANVDVSKDGIDYLNDQNSRVWKFNEEMANLVEEFTVDGTIDREGLTETILGKRDDVLARAHVSNKPSVDAKYEADKLDIERMLDTWNMVQDKEFYIPWDYTKSDRSMMNISELNPQNSKISRFLTSMEDMTHTVDTSKKLDIAIANAALAQALDYDIDKQSDKAAIDEMGELFTLTTEGVTFKDKDFEKAVKDGSLKAIRVWNPDISTDELMHVYQAVKLLKKISEGDTKPTTSLNLEIDGITNGMMATLMQAGYHEGTKHHMVKGGIYVKQDTDIKNHGEYKATEGKDIYETPIDMVKGILERDTNAGDALDTIINNKWRNFMKDPVMIFIYGASMPNIRKTIAESIVHGNSYIKGAVTEGKFAELAQLADMTERDMVKYLSVATYDKESKRLVYKPFRPTTKNGQIVYPDNVVANPKNSFMIANAIDSHIGIAFEIAFNAEFEAVVKFRQALKIVEEMNYMVFKAELNKKLDERGVKRITDLHPEEVEKVYKELLEEGTYYGAENATGGIQDYVKLDKPVELDDSNDLTLTIPSQLGLAAGNTSTTLTQQIKEIISNVGAVGVVTIHDIDGTVMIKGNSKAVLNIYDALVMGINPKTAKEQAMDMNKAFYDVNMRHSILNKAVQKLITNADKLTPENIKGLNPQALLNDVTRIMGGDIEGFSVDGIMEMLETTDEARLAMQDLDITMNQYYVSDMLPGYKLEDSILVETVFDKDTKEDQKDIVRRKLELLHSKIYEVGTKEEPGIISNKEQSIIDDAKQLEC